MKGARAAGRRLRRPPSVPDGRASACRSALFLLLRRRVSRAPFFRFVAGEASSSVAGAANDTRCARHLHRPNVCRAPPPLIARTTHPALVTRRDARCDDDDLSRRHRSSRPTSTLSRCATSTRCSRCGATARGSSGPSRRTTTRSAPTSPSRRRPTSSMTCTTRRQGDETATAVTDCRRRAVGGGSRPGFFFTPTWLAVGRRARRRRTRRAAAHTTWPGRRTTRRDATTTTTM